MTGSGLSDILLEAGLISSSFLKGTLSGKQYDRVLILKRFLETTGAESHFPSLPAVTMGLLTAAKRTSRRLCGAASREQRY